MARQIALEAVRNSYLEELHSKYFGDKDMRILMLEIENNLRLCLWYWSRHQNDQQILEMTEAALWDGGGVSWDLSPSRWKRIKQIHKEMEKQKEVSKK